MKARVTNFGEYLPATYKFSTTNFNGTFNYFRTPVLVLGETEKRYLIRLKEPIRDHFVGDEILVGKKSIEFPPKEVDTSEFWYNRD